MIFLGMIDNLKTKHINVLAIQLSCQNIFSSYLGYNKTFVIKYYKTFTNVSVITSSYPWVGYLHASSLIRAFCMYRSIKKVISLCNISKVFSHFIIHLWSMFYNTYYEMFMPFCFYKPYQRIIRQQLYISIKYIPLKYNNIL